MKIIDQHNVMKNERNLHLTFDVFIRNKELVIVGPSPTPEILIDDISVSVDNKNLRLIDLLVKDDSQESYRIFIYECNFDKDEIEVEIKYNGFVENYKLKNHTNTMNYTLTITTCFKDDYELFPMWYDYYTKQGVEFFYMYFNGKITDEIKELFDKPNVILHEWDFNYWSPYGNRLHYAQMGQLQHALHKYGKYSSEFMLFCDLDEYMYFHNSTLIEKIRENPDIDQLVFFNCWAKRIEDKITKTFPEKFYLEEQQKPCQSRRKGLYRTSKTNSLAVHVADVCTNMLKNKDDIAKYPELVKKRHNTLSKTINGIHFHFKTKNLPYGGRDFKFGNAIFPDDLKEHLKK